MILKGISHDSGEFLNDFPPPPPPKPPIEAFLSWPVISYCLLATVPRQPWYLLPADDPPAPSPLSTSTEPPTEASFLTGCHLFQPMQFHCCSLRLSVRPDPCITDTTVINWSIKKHHEEADLFC